MAKFSLLKNGLPINPVEVFKQGKYFSELRAKQLVINLVLDPLADDELIGDARVLFVPETANCTIRTIIIGSEKASGQLKRADVTYLVLSDTLLSREETSYGERIRSLVDLLVYAGDPFALITRSAQVSQLAEALKVNTQHILHVDSFDELSAQVARWSAENLSDERLALASNFEFMRHAIAQEIIKKTSLQNGVIGGVMFIPGADMPLLTLNQIKMVMQTAAVYGADMNKERIKEIVSVVAGAFVSRTIARELVALVPGVGWAIKAAIAYGATFAMGLSVLEYFSMGGSDLSLKDFLINAKDDIIDRAKTIASDSSIREKFASKATGLTKDAYKETKRLYFESKGNRAK